MEVIEIDSKSYAEIFSKPSHVFNSAIFNSFNAYKCENVYYLIFKDTKVRLGIILGLREGVLISPFSAPFGGFEYLREDIRLFQIDTALDALKNWSKAYGFKGINIVLPPFFYRENFLNKLSNSLFRAGYLYSNVNLNYQYYLSNFNDNYVSTICHNTRRNLKIAFKSELFFEKINVEEGDMAYDIIVQNRKERGFPLNMTWKQVLETISIIPIDFFVVKKDNINIASAIIFHVADGIVQVVYWGDLPQFSDNKTMNFLAYNIFKHYKESGIKIVDVGPSTENSIPNHGLCEFKESIGCDLSPKYSFCKKIE
ncbi:hypothetical protein QWY90_04990 [Flavobacterium paronense]|uniref:GNAT family N-acetyltransferase n=1 Tax=Flavobacterium paronense TaxID=1392775 RepID=A0ABV5GAL2_9FLAO|nr:hypothetical protein [Flavobacterium paronense]MDN3676664.1 hypothetical protein [Flavobacterium paronense]